MNILFTCAGRRNYLLRYFKEELNGSGKVLATDMSANATALQEADKWFIVPSVSSDGYVQNLLDLCNNNEVSLVISLNDLELPILSRSKKLFEEVGTTVLISSAEVVDLCFDKLKTHEFLQANKFLSPQTFIDLTSAKAALDSGSISFPLFIKPRWGSASVQLYTVYSHEELESAFHLAQAQLQRTFLKVDEHLAGQSILIQEGLPGDEYGIDILNDFSGNVKSVFVKRKLGMRAGETDKSSLSDDAALLELGKSLGKAVGHIGNLDCDVFYDGTTVSVLEMNPRFGGGYPFSHTLGANYPRAIIEWHRGMAFDCDQFEKDTGKVVSKCEELLVVGK